MSRVRQLVEKGDPRAKIVERAHRGLGRVVSGVQVGITIASLSLGYLGEITLAGDHSSVCASVRASLGGDVAHTRLHW